MPKDLLALADEFEDKARALRLAYALLHGESVTAAQRALPRKLAAASRQLRAKAGNSDGRKSIAQIMIDAVARGPLTFAEVKAATGINPSGHLSRLVTNGTLTQSPIAGSRNFRYTLTPAGRARVSDGGPDDPPTRTTKGTRQTPAKRRKARAKVANDPPTALRGKKLSAFLLTTIAESPQTGPDLVAALQAVGHPIETGNGIAGPLSKITAAGWLRRNKRGVYAITPKGRRRLTPQNGATAEHTPAPA